MSATQPDIPILDLSPEIESLWDELNDAVQRVMRSGKFIMGPDVVAFEEEVADYLDTKHAISVNSGTDALVISLRALGIATGDEVITTPFSFFATAESISQVGATPIFVDISEDSFNIDPKLIEAAITPRTKAIMPVHLYGNPAAMSHIKEIAANHNLKIIEDCAQSFGARYYGDCSDCQQDCSSVIRSELFGKHTGTIGDMGAFSFFPSKNLGAFGDGGLIVTDDDSLAEQARMLRAHGSRKKYHNEMIGYNSRLDSLQAAVLRVKLPHIDNWNAQRRKVAERYNQQLADVAGIITPVTNRGHVFHQYTVRITDLKISRGDVQRQLKDNSIGTMVYYPVPQDKLPVYAEQSSSQPVSDRLAEQVLSLPIGPSLSTTVVDTVSEALAHIVP